MTAHPYMPNSTHALRDELLRAVGVTNIEELFVQIPREHRVSAPLDLPPPLASEPVLRRHLLELLDRNEDCERNLSFLGGGLWQHHVPAIVDEITRRSEFLTPVWGTPSSDHGRNQAWFEFASQLAELIEMDFVGLPVYSWGCAEGYAIRMATRLTRRSKVLVARRMSPERLAVIGAYCGARGLPHIEIELLEHDPAVGGLSLEDVRAKLRPDVAAILVENPGFLGTFEEKVGEIATLARANGSETIVGVDPSSLGVVAAPGSYGADIVVGSLQPLGVHMSCGGGVGGFIATRDESRYAHEYPTLNLSVTRTVAGELGFGIALFHQTSYGMREAGNDWTGNSTYLHAIANAAYMSLLGPGGFVDLGRVILERSHDAASQLGSAGIRVLSPPSFFKEFVVNYDDSGLTVAQVNARLRKQGIFGGIDLSFDFPELGQSSLVCVTEVHTESDIRRFVAATEEVLH